MLAFDRPWALFFLVLAPGLAVLDRLLRARGLAFPFSTGRPGPAPRAPAPWRVARALRSACVGIGVASCVVAAAGPAIVNRRTLYLSRGNEVVFVLDVSPSMAASDFSPTRLGAAKAIIGDFLATRRNETVGLVAFGSEAALICPPTLDYQAFASRLGALVPGLYGEGTAIGSGIATAVAHAARSGAPEKHVVLLTDGENNAGSIDPGTAALIAARYGVILSVIGVGSPGEVPVAYSDPATGHRRAGVYASGFDPAALEALAARGGGQYYAAANKAALASAFASVSERSASLARTRSVSSEEPLSRPFLLASFAALTLARLLALALTGTPAPPPRGDAGMRLARPEFLWLALLVLPELLLARRRRRLLVSSAGYLAGPRRRGRAQSRLSIASLGGTLFAALFVLFAALALASPSWGRRGRATERSGLELAFVLDVSRSMNARDGSPTRLDAAKSLVRSLLRSLSASSGPDRPVYVSLVAAKGDAVLLVPMTEDAESLDGALDHADSDTLTAVGTNLERGLARALASFPPAGAGGRMIVLLTDGGELSGRARAAAEDARGAGARLIVVGVGGETEAPVPGAAGPALDARGDPAMSALDAAFLRGLAAAAEGRYLDASDPATASALAAEITGGRAGGVRVEYETVDRTSLFAALALAALLGAILAELLAARGGRP